MPLGWYTPLAKAEDKPTHKVERVGVGAIGLRYQGTVITEKAREYGDIVALCDVDRHVREQAWRVSAARRVFSRIIAIC
ncbi:MAG: hypothetical protein R3C12_06865 [Planctomycetaceae bacterium]